MPTLQVQPRPTPEERQDRPVEVEVDGTVDVGERTVELVDAGWIGAVADLPEDDIGPVAGHWIDLLDEELGPLSREDKPWIRTLVADLVQFAQAARSAPAVVFAWSI